MPIQFGKRQKAKSKRQKAKVIRMRSFDLVIGVGGCRTNGRVNRKPKSMFCNLTTFAFCLLLFAFCLFPGSPAYCTMYIGATATSARPIANSSSITDKRILTRAPTPENSRQTRTPHSTATTAEPCARAEPMEGPT